MAPKSGWVEAIGLPPPGGSTDVGQVGVPTNVNIKVGAGSALVVSTSGIVGVQVTFADQGSGGLTARAWLFVGTWRCVLAANVTSVLLSPPTTQFPGAPDVSVWVEQSPRDAAC